MLDQIRNEIVASVERSFRRPKTLPVRTFQEVISPSTQIEPHVSTKPRIVSFRRATEVGASAVESRGRTESGGGGWPGTGSAWNVVIRSSRVVDRGHRPGLRTRRLHGPRTGHPRRLGV